MPTPTTVATSSRDSTTFDMFAAVPVANLRALKPNAVRRCVRDGRARVDLARAVEASTNDAVSRSRVSAPRGIGRGRRARIGGAHAIVDRRRREVDFIPVVCARAVGVDAVARATTGGWMRAGVGGGGFSARRRLRARRRERDD